MTTQNDFAAVRLYLPRGGNGWAESNDALDRIKAELESLRAKAQSGGWVACGVKPPPFDRYVLMWDPKWSTQYQPERLQAAVSPNLEQRWLDCSGNEHSDLLPRYLWQLLPAPPEAT